MALKQNNETGEVYDDGLETIPERPTIEGYGDRAIINKGGQPWTTASGDIAPPEYVKDVRDTIAAVDSGAMSEPQLTAKIRGQAPGAKPTDELLAMNERWMKFKEAVIKESGINPEKAYEEAKTNHAKSFYGNMEASDISLMKPEAKAKIETEAEARGVAARNTVQNQLNMEVSAARSFFDRQIQEDMKIAAEKRSITNAAQKAEDKEAAKKDALKGVLSPEAIQVEGVKFALTGKMPAMGMGGLMGRAMIMNAGAEYLKAQGVDPSTVPAMQSEYTAMSQTLNALTKATEQVRGFEKGLIKNADYALELSKNVFRTSVIPVNEVMNYFKTKTGDPGIVKFGAALYAAAMEYEKIRTAGTGITSAELSVGAQKKAEEIMNKAQSHEQLTAVIEALKQDTENVMTGREETMKGVADKMKEWGTTFGKKENAGNAPPASSLKEGVDTKFGNGQVWTLRNGKPVKVR